MVYVLGTVFTGCITASSAPQSPQEGDCVSGHPPTRVRCIGGGPRTLPEPWIPPFVDAVAHAAQEDACIAPVGPWGVSIVNVVLCVSVAFNGGRLCLRRHGSPLRDVDKKRRYCSRSYRVGAEASGVALGADGRVLVTRLLLLQSHNTQSEK